MFGSSFHRYGSSQREPDYMDVVFPYFNISNSSSSSSSGSVGRIEQGLKDLNTTVNNTNNIDSTDTIQDAPLFHSEAKNIKDRQALVEQNMMSNDILSIKTDTFDLDEYTKTYNYYVCSDCGVDSKIVCIECRDSFCDVCYATNHRTGKRALHHRVSRDVYIIQTKQGIPASHIVNEPPALIDDNDMTHYNNNDDNTMSNGDDDNNTMSNQRQQSSSGFLSSIFRFINPTKSQNSSQNSHNNNNNNNNNSQSLSPLPQQQQQQQHRYDNNNNSSTIPVCDPSELQGWWATTPPGWIRGRSLLMPLRLNHQERYHLRLLISVIDASNYVSCVDKSLPPARRTLAMAQGCLSVLTALIAAKDISYISNCNISHYKDYLESVLELGVRHHLRQQKQNSWYYPLMCLLQDLNNPAVEKLIGCKIRIKIKTVYDLMSKCGVLNILDSHLVYMATETICPEVGQNLAQIISKRKTDALNEILSLYGTTSTVSSYNNTKYGTISKETLRLCLMSIADHNSNLQTSRDICTRLGRLIGALYGIDNIYNQGINQCIDIALINAPWQNATIENVAKTVSIDLNTLNIDNTSINNIDATSHLSLDPSSIEFQRKIQYAQSGGSSSSSNNSSPDNEQSSSSSYKKYNLRTVYNNDLSGMVRECFDITNTKYYKSDKYIINTTTNNNNNTIIRSLPQHIQHVLRTIMLWETISHYLPFLDLLSVYAYLIEPVIPADHPPGTPYSTYTLCKNGQGYVRIQNAVLLQRAMQSLVVSVLRGVGSQAIHVGDSAVPNALAVTDKYLQLNPLLTPVFKTAQWWWSNTNPNHAISTPRITSLSTLLSSSSQTGHRQMLHNWSLHAMDGQGGDNVYSAGSCIDGRLTSLWHWCNHVLPQSLFYVLFNISGFTSFDQIDRYN